MSATRDRGLGPDVERLRAAFARGDDPPAGACLTDAEIWDGLHGELAPDRLRDVVEHLASCAACAESWRVGLLLESDAPGAAAADLAVAAYAAEGSGAGAAGAGFASRDAEGSLVPFLRTSGRRLRRWRYAVAGGIAAMLALVAFGITQYSAVSPPPVAVQRGGGAEVSAVAWRDPEGTALQRQNAQVRWQGPPDATYDLEVNCTAGCARTAPATSSAPAAPATSSVPAAPIVRVRGLTDGAYRIAPGDLAALPSGARLEASLTAHLADGSSPETIFRDFTLR
jgi:hypothetical protein